MGKGKGLAGALALSFAAVASSASAFPFFFIFPIPRGSVDPDKIDASLEQRKLAMCAAYHQNVIDPEVSGKRETTYHGDIVKAVMDRLSTFPNAKKLVGTYIGQWRLQAKQNYQSGQDYARMLIEGCNHANLPVNKLQYDDWKSSSVGNTASKPSNAQPAAQPAAQPTSAPAPQNLSDDAILDTAMNRCDRIGFKRGQDDFKSCVMQQIRLLSDVK